MLNDYYSSSTTVGIKRTPLIILTIMFHVAYVSVVIFWAAAKTGVPGPFGAENRYVLKSSQTCTMQALPLVQNALYLVLAG